MRNRHLHRMIHARAGHITSVIAAITFMFASSFTSLAATPDVGDETADVHTRADQAFERLDRAITMSPALQPVKGSPSAARTTTYSPEQYLIGTGQGDLSKGRVTCQRVAELSARAELAKQIRVLIKEHAIDRTRERTGHNTEQDLEITREEIVQEYLQGVKIVDRHVDEGAGLCSSTAVMPLSPATTPPLLNHDDSSHSKR